MAYQGRVSDAARQQFARRGRGTRLCRTPAKAEGLIATIAADRTSISSIRDIWTDKVGDV
jgi:hypothetical protein